MRDLNTLKFNEQSYRYYVSTNFYRWRGGNFNSLDFKRIKDKEIIRQLNSNKWEHKINADGIHNVRDEYNIERDYYYYRTDGNNVYLILRPGDV